MASDRAILQSALKRELDAAKSNLKSAFWDMGKMVQFDGSKDVQLPGYANPRGVVDQAIKKLRDAADYYDAVKKQLDDLEASA